MKNRLLLALLLVLVLSVVGCKQGGPETSSQQGGVNTVTKASLLPGKKEPLPDRLLLSDEDMSDFFDISLNYFELVRNGDREEAIKLFLPSTKRAAEMLLAKDSELARETPADYAPKTLTNVWYQDGKLWLRENAKKVNADEIERLITLTKAYKKAVIVVIETESGSTRKLLAVKDEGKFALLP